MTKKKIENRFVPFVHENLELKNRLIEWARNLKSKTEPEAQLASVIIYANFVEYLAEHMLKTFRYIIHQSSYNYFAAIIFINNDQGLEPKFMWEKLKELEKYEFPDKVGVISLFKEVSMKRNDLFHNLAKANEDELSGYDGDMLDIQDLSEQLLAKINTIYAGLQNILYGVEAENAKNHHR